MKPLFLLLALTALASPLLAQNAAPTPARKSLTFQPGAKSPDEKVAAPVPVTANAVAAIPNGSDESFNLAAAFFGSLQKGLVEDAYANLTKGSKIGDRSEEMRSLKARTSEALALFGEVRGFELIETKAVGTALRRYTFVSFGRDLPLRWRFYFYKTDAQWRLIDLHVDDRLAGIFEEQEPLTPETGKQ